MNAAHERSRSLWMDTPCPEAPRLEQDLRCEALVIGAGIAGLSAAYELAELGKQVVVVDRGAIGGGMTARTTAHLAYAIDDFYDALIGRRGEDVARAYFESQRAAVDRIEEIVAKQSIACDFARVDGFFVPADDHGRQMLDKELQAARKAGFADVEFSAPPQGYDAPALRFPNQARLHPLKYLTGLYEALRGSGVRVFANTPVLKLEERHDRIVAELADGRCIEAAIAVSATNSPINDLVAIHTKQAPYRSFVFAAPVPRGSVADVLVWDTLDPYHYVRVQPGQSEDMLIVGGEDHKSGLEDDGAERIARLLQWAKDRYPMLGDVAYAWSGQVYEPIDYTPHAGRNPGDRNTYVITGDSGQGMTSGVAGALLIAQLLRDGASPWEEAYDPSRKTITAAGAFLSENLDVAGNLTEHVYKHAFTSFDELQRGQGAIGRVDGKQVAAYRDDSGALHVLSPSCTHLGCLLHFNSFERCWDCPCHGSQFGVDGEVLAGPAKAALHVFPQH